jgi:hypothetical protein
VDHSVVSPAEEEQIGDVGFAAVYPVHIVMYLGVPVGEITARESAAFVSFADGFRGWCWDGSGKPADVEGFGDSAGDDPTDFCVTTNSEGHFAGEAGVPVLGFSRPTREPVERVEVDVDLYVWSFTSVGAEVFVVIEKEPCDQAEGVAACSAKFRSSTGLSSVGRSLESVSTCS